MHARLCYLSLFQRETDDTDHVFQHSLPFTLLPRPTIKAPPCLSPLKCHAGLPYALSTSLFLFFPLPLFPLPCPYPSHRRPVEPVKRRSKHSGCHGGVDFKRSS